MYHKLKTSKS